MRRGSSKEGGRGVDTTLFLIRLFQLRFLLLHFGVRGQKLVHSQYVDRRYCK